MIEQYTREDKCGNHLIYKSSFNSLKVFTKGKLDISFSDRNTSWLTKYEKWLRSKNNKETTISLMFRTLRSTYNKAIKAKCARNMWKFYNLLTGANKSSYIDSFLDRSLNATEMALGINAALHGDERYKWFID